LILAFLWCISLTGFALSPNLDMALVLLVFAGFLELSFSSMTQAIVQMNAPENMRGRVVGLYNMSSLGMRAGSGLVVGVGGSLIGIHYAMILSCALLISVVSVLYVRLNKAHVLTQSP